MTIEEFVRYVSDPDRLVRQLRAAAAISEGLRPSGLWPIVVGGAAVEFYTRGAYTTVDVDMIVEGLAEIDAVLRDLGFTRLAGTSYVHPQVDVVVDLLPEPLTGDARRVVEVDVDGRKARIIGLDDILADRLRAAVYWSDLSSKEWAVQMMAAQWEHIDWAYLDELATVEQPAFVEVLSECRQMAKAVVDGSPA